MAGRLKNKSAARRDYVEWAMFELRTAERDIDEVILRSQQAKRRTSLVDDVLDPAIERLVEIRKRVKRAKLAMNENWIEGQAHRWENIDEH